MRNGPHRDGGGRSFLVVAGDRLPGQLLQLCLTVLGLLPEAPQVPLGQVCVVPQGRRQDGVAEGFLPQRDRLSFRNWQGMGA